VLRMCATSRSKVADARHEARRPVLYDGFVRHWMMAAAVVMIGVALSAGAMPWLQAAAGAFKPADLAQDIAAARVVASGANPYDVGVQAVQANILHIPVEAGYPYFPHPPVAVVVAAPIAGLPFSAAALIWFAGSLALLFALSVLLAEVVSGRKVGAGKEGPSTGTTMTIFLLLLAWPPVLYNLEKGQWSIIVALLLAFAWRSLRREQPASAGACIGAAAAVKIFPVLLAGYLLTRSRRALVWAFIVGAIGTFAPFMWMGDLALPAFIRQSQGNLAYWETWPAVTHSIHGAAARLFTGGRWAQPLVSVPMLTRFLAALAGIALLVIAIAVTERHRLRDDREDARFAAWNILLVATNPLSMGHNAVLLALPIVLLVRVLAHDRRTWPRAAWLAGVVLASIPRQTIVSLAPVPVDPWRGVAIVALPMWGTLFLFAAAIAVSVEPSVRASKGGRETKVTRSSHQHEPVTERAGQRDR
jgi:uncharacterized membrane protein YhaH (DUF805 family)